MSDTMITTMKKLELKEKEALAFWIISIFNAEQNVDIEKFNAVKTVQREYSITPDHIAKGKKRTMEYATEMLAGSTVLCREELHRSLYDIASSDKYCAPEEALLLTALYYHFNEDGRIFSVKAEDLKLDGKTAYFVMPSPKVYKDKDFIHDCSDHIKRHLDELVMCFYCFGYDFVYVPQLVKDYSSDPAMVQCLHEFASNFGDASLASIDKAIEEFSSFGTAEFTNMIFSNREKDKLDDHDQPGFLIKLSDTYVNRKKYYNFIYIPILSSGISAIINTAKNFFLKYLEKVSYTKYLVAPELPNRLRHFDLYSTILDYRIRNGEKVESTITIDLNTMSVVFNELHTSVHLETHIVDYLYLAWKSQSGFVDEIIRRGKDPQFCDSIRPLRELRRILFADIYPGKNHKIISGYRAKTYVIKTKIEAIANLSNPSYYYPVIYKERNSPFPIGYEIRFNRVTILDTDHKKYKIDESPTCKELYDYL